MDTSSSADPLFSIRPGEESSTRQQMLSLIMGPVETLSGLKRLRETYRHIEGHRDPKEFMRAALDDLRITPAPESRDKFKIPASGPCVVISNHPFGMIEGVILVEMALGIRPDVKVMANYLLEQIPQLRSIMILVDPFEGKDAATTNVRPLREAIRWVENGGLLIVFPAGEVSHYTLSRREVADPPWKKAVAVIIRRAKPTVVPVYFPGCNSVAFQVAGLIHPRLRTLLLARELVGKEGRRIRYKIGNPISYQWVSHYKDHDRLLDYLRWRTYIMGHSEIQNPVLKLPEGIKTRRRKPLAPHPSPEACKHEIAELPAEQRLVQSGRFSVWHARADQIPHILREIGYLREKTFRLAGEGTGKPIDLDRFDEHYLHLFVWNDEAGEIAGAYRIGRTDVILASMGKEGLYTNTLFKSAPDFYHRLGPALEMGRSFVRSEYQKTYFPLLLLWRGIGTFIARNPKYRILFGPVSIDGNYSNLSRRLMAETLLKKSDVKDLAVMVKPRRPARLKSVRIRGCNHSCRNIELKDFMEVCAVVSDIEARQSGVPVLLKHYLNLGGQLLSFNIDKSFSGIMDGLIVVDLLKTNDKALKRYMGEAAASRYCAFHGGRWDIDSLQPCEKFASLTS